MSLSDAQITRLVKGDINAFREIHDDMYHSLCLYGYKMLSDQYLVADIVQEAFMVLWNRREEFTTLLGTRSYLYKIVRNKIINHIRKEQPVFLEDNPTDELLIDNQISKEETYKLVRAAVAKLPDRTCKVVELTINGHTNAEIAEFLGVSINTVKTLKKKGYAKLREMLKDNIYLLLLLTEIFQ
ncbi:RNA polymerase sigma factor [Marinifilum sp.]|uniref:RNA polymerase sigma factor n=1 Tax=Marinifilum sp. TaxID=2033137 RepID=UPI003BABF526